MRLSKSVSVIALLCGAYASSGAQTVAGRPAHIILIRHAEKPANADDPHLSAAGVSRAQRLVSFITTDPAMTKLGKPVAIFASRPTKHGNGQRTQETVAPLAAALGVPVQTPYGTDDYAKLATLILSRADYAGKTILVCWTHDDITKLAGALGMKPRPPKWKASVYDRVDVISYQQPAPTLSTLSYR
jgi:hypothetical protein